MAGAAEAAVRPNPPSITPAAKVRASFVIPSIRSSAPAARRAYKPPKAFMFRGIDWNFTAYRSTRVEDFIVATNVVDHKSVIKFGSTSIFYSELYFYPSFCTGRPDACP
jgi:hypothetical protein